MWVWSISVKSKSALPVIWRKTAPRTLSGVTLPIRNTDTPQFEHKIKVRSQFQSVREIYVRTELRSHICWDCRRGLMGFECAWQRGGNYQWTLGGGQINFFSKQNCAQWWSVPSQSNCSELEPNLLVRLSQSGIWANNKNPTWKNKLHLAFTQC